MEEDTLEAVGSQSRDPLFRNRVIIDVKQSDPATDDKLFQLEGGSASDAHRSTGMVAGTFIHDAIRDDLARWIYLEDFDHHIAIAAGGGKYGTRLVS